MTRFRVEGCVVVGLLALAACGGGGGDAASEDDSAGPLAELMGWEVQEPAEQRRQELEVQQHIVECMRAEGWDYEPVDWSAQMPDTADEDMALGNDPEAYGAKYGYGVARNYELYDAENIEAGDGNGRMGVEFEDPNQEYMSSLTEDEMMEYQATLYGDPEIWESEPDENGVFVSPPLEDQGCQGQAQLAVHGEDPMSDPDIQERMNEFWEGQQDDPRMEAAYADWAECMGEDIEGLEAGFEDVSRPDQMYQVFDARKMELMGLEVRPVDRDDPSAYDDIYSSFSDASGENEIGYYGQPELIGDADLERLRADELTMWQQDWDCQEDADIRDLQRRIEQEMVDGLVADFPELAERATAAEGS